MRSLPIAALFAALLTPQSGQAEQGFTPGTLLEIEKKVQTTPTAWVWDTVVSSYDTVRYDLRIRVGSQVFTTEYIPDVQPNGPLPIEWQPGRVMNVQVDKGKMLIKLSYDGTVETQVVKRERSK